jgi:hypothetical protein
MTIGRLLGVEIRRFLSRRLVRTIAALVVLGIAVAGVLVFVNHSADDPGAELFRITSLTDVFIGTGIPLFMLSWVLGASFAGAEWHTGMVGTVLTWEPRRFRVVLAKLGVAMVLGFVGTVVMQALVGVALFPTAELRGSTAGMDGVWWRDVAVTVLRSATVSAMAAGIGFSLAWVARNTGAALGIGFGYLLVVEQLLAGLRPRWQPWLLLVNMATFLSGETQEVSGGVSVSVGSAGLLLAAYSAGLALIATVLFLRRDVT